MTKKQNLVITTGPTGGHFFPALCFAECYGERHPDAIIWFLVAREPSFLQNESVFKNFRFRVIAQEPPGALRSRRFFLSFLRLIRTFISTVRFLVELKPTSVVSFGSYSSVPAVLGACFLRIPVVVHEQNRVFGWANRLGNLFAKRTATSFPDTEGAIRKNTIHYIGYPIRRSLRALPPRTARNGSVVRLLVIGGSQGASAINRAVLNFFRARTLEEKQKFAVIHISGSKEFHELQAQYRALDIPHEVHEFVKEMDHVYERVDMVIARAGAGTIFELAAMRLPSVLVPYPFAYAHQSKNAGELAARGAAIVCDESRLRTPDFENAIFKFTRDSERRAAMGQAAGELDRAEADIELVKLVDEVSRIV